MFTIHASRVFTPDRLVATATVRVENGLIVSVDEGEPNGRHIDLTLTEGYLVPGFVDIQVNGY